MLSYWNIDLCSSSAMESYFFFCLEELSKSGIELVVREPFNFVLFRRSVVIRIVIDADASKVGAIRQTDLLLDVSMYVYFISSS